ncbi:hypothetical protein QUB70_23410 [Microcoleus sp. A003_D6]
MPIPQEKKICGMGRRARPSYFCKRSIKPALADKNSNIPGLTNDRNSVIPIFYEAA